jgi:hypothetical protein
MAMRTWCTSLLAGIAAAAVGVIGAAALAQSANIHVMTVQLPGGGTAQVEYTGNVAPQVSISNAPAPIAAFVPMPTAQFFGPDSAFAQLDRISAEMDRQAAMMFRQAEQLAAAARSGQMTETAMQTLPPGSRDYTFISTVFGNNVCTQSMQITTPNNGGPPHLVTHNSGNCVGMPGIGGAAGAVSLLNAATPMSRPGPVWTSAPAPANQPDVVWTAAHGSQPYVDLVEPIPTTTAPH